MKSKIAVILISLMVLSNLVRSHTYAASENHDLAIVIDDFGNHMKGTDEMLNLPVHLTVAVMPFMPSTGIDAETAWKKGHEVIVHMPMEPKKGKKSWLGPGAITADLSEKEVRKRVEAAIENVPHAVGMNHHMGSKITEDERIMRIVLQVCAEKGLYYLDSKTTENSVIPKVAEELQLPYLENNLFFDDVYTRAHIDKQARRLFSELDNNKETIAIGHVGITGPMMVSVLKSYLPQYHSKVNIVPLSALIHGREWITGKSESPFESLGGDSDFIIGGNISWESAKIDILS
ncbi:divergent polysaccharide deacetylase family protein [Cytobacillus horneckiae]|uniref:divergent polysaccharide deacetylase family protein n=1 Tax=Cytobacillus horneckiae TaxID=549687 RepID=UPI0039A23E88